MQIIFSGSIGRSVTGGQAWANLQYLIGLRALGHDVYYLEDCGEWSSVYNWDTQETTWELDYPASYINECLGSYGFQDNWIYRAGQSSLGLSIEAFCEILEQSDLLIIRGIPFLTWRAEYNLPRNRAFIDVDPGFTQFCHERGEPAFVETIGSSESLFTIGQHIGNPDCPIPTCGRQWLKTVSPVEISEWPVMDDGDQESFTSVIRWRGMKDMNYKGVEYGQRNREFAKFMPLPGHTQQHLKIALTGGGSSVFNKNGWEVVEGWSVTRTPQSYQDFIQNSRAEFGVAKNTYVDTRSGWFSDRSACYLASGRPVLVQDTAAGNWLPVGEGAMTFRDLRDAVSGIDMINSDYERHCQAARDLAVEYFATEKVLPALLEAAIS